MVREVLWILRSQLQKSIVSGLTTFFIAFVFAIYILLQKEKLGVQAKKVLFAFVRRGRAEATVEVLSLTYNTFSSFLTGQCVEAVILGSMFAVSMTILKLPYCASCRGADCIYCIDPYLRRIRRVRCRRILDFHGGPDESTDLRCTVSCIAAN